MQSLDRVGRWSRTDGYLSSDAFTGGYEADGRTLHVVCAYIDGVFTPGKYGHHLSGACIPYGREEKVCEWFYYLVNSNFEKWIYSWEHASNGNVPHNALKVDEGMYVGRVHHAGSLIPCKVHTSHNCAYFGYDGREHSSREYEVLVYTLKSNQVEEQKEAKE
ncbi:natterin-3-like [Saccostrea echinata]|uniref:natterin-3-like n=1 Tax=Saccostrea echinata TaxID=191078 RepID=UPI002A80FC46|nr:natterin-3-like [Saccostrea echinata]